jgi:hypothetical protein
VNERRPSASPISDWVRGSGILHRFAADIVSGVLPDDLFAQQSVIRKAEAMGIDIGVQTGANVVRLADRVRTRWIAAR